MTSVQFHMLCAIFYESDLRYRVTNRPNRARTVWGSHVNMQLSGACTCLPNNIPIFATEIQKGSFPWKQVNNSLWSEFSLSRTLISPSPEGVCVCVGGGGGGGGGGGL